MSKPEIPKEKPLTPEQQDRQMFSLLSIQFKNPVRNAMGEAEEFVQNTISNLIQQLMQIHNLLKNSNEQIIRLQKLCTDNHIAFSPKPPNISELKV